MPFRSLKPYLFDGFYRWCVDDGQTPHIEFEVTRDCQLPRPLSDNLHQSVTLNISPTACRDMNIDNDGLSFVARFSGVSFRVFIPLAALTNIYSKESKRTIPLNFTEVVLDPDQPLSSGVPSLSVPAGTSSLALVPAAGAVTERTPGRKRHLALVWDGQGDAPGPSA